MFEINRIEILASNFFFHSDFGSNFRSQLRKVVVCNCTGRKHTCYEVEGDGEERGLHPPLPTRSQGHKSMPLVRFAHSWHSFMTTRNSRKIFYDHRHNKILDRLHKEARFAQTICKASKVHLMHRQSKQPRKTEPEDK